MEKTTTIAAARKARQEVRAKAMPDPVVQLSLRCLHFSEVLLRPLPALRRDALLTHPKVKATLVAAHCSPWAVLLRER